MCCKLTFVEYTPLKYNSSLRLSSVFGSYASLLYMQMSSKSANKKGEKQADKKIKPILRPFLLNNNIYALSLLRLWVY